MTRWSDQFEKHQIHSTVQTLREWTDVEVEEIDAEHEDERRRFRKVLDFIQSAIDGQDSELFPVQLLTDLDNQLRSAQIWNQIKNYSSNPTVQQLRTANDQLTRQLYLVYNIAAVAGSPDTVKTVQSIEDAYSRFCKAVELAEQRFEARLSESEEKLAELQNGLSENNSVLEHLKAQSDQAFNEWKNEFGDDQNSRAEAFSEAQIQRGEKFDEVMREIRANSEAETRSISNEHSERLTSSFKEYKQEVEARLDDMKAKHDEILEIHGLVGTDGVAGGYLKTAIDERKAANLWRIVAMGALGLAAVWLLVRFCLGFDDDSIGWMNWAELVSSGSLTLVLLTAAGYASTQSRNHRDLEQQMRWFSLEVKAIDPFISSLGEAEKQELKKQLSERLFGKDRTANEVKKRGSDVGSYKEIFELFLSHLREISKLSDR